MKFTYGILLVAIPSQNVGNAFTSPMSNRIGISGKVRLGMESDILEDDTATKEREKQKEALMGLFGSKKGRTVDPVLACPESKEPLSINSRGTILMNDISTGVPVTLESSDKKYKGRTNTYYNLLEPEDDNNDDLGKTDNTNSFLKNLQVFIPPPLRPVIMNDDKYIPMRDLFTSPSVSFAYERGWRQGFSAAGFPGADKEFEMVQDYFRPVMTDNLNPTTVVDMSCATGLFTRRLAKSNVYDRVIACDYSDSMLTEARRRIVADKDLSNTQGRKTKLDLVRCDVGKIPMTSNSLDALHAGAAMHCWPDLDSALSEIYRVLKPGGRYFATTFLSNYFSVIQATGGDTIQQQAFQLFESTDILRDMVTKAGFEESNVQVEVLGKACVVIRAEK